MGIKQVFDKNADNRSMNKEILNQIPKLSQRQDATDNQLRDLMAVANRLDMYDAADTIRKLVSKK